MSERQTTRWLPKAPSADRSSGESSKIAIACRKCRRLPETRRLQNSTVPKVYAPAPDSRRLLRQVHVLFGDRERLPQFTTAVVHIEQAKQHIHSLAGVADVGNEMIRALPAPKDARAVMHEAITQSALLSAERAIELGLGPDKIVLSAKVSAVQDLIQVYAMLAARSDLALHLGLTEAGMGSKGIVASSAALAVLLQQGIGDTIRISLTPEPKGDRTLEVKVAQELLQSMGFRSFVPLVAACPGCGRTTSTTFQELARDIQDFIRDSMPEWKRRYPGVETLTVAVMGCIVNGPGESKHADIGISLPGTGEAPAAPVFIDGKKAMTLRGPGAADEFKQMVLDYIERRYGQVGRSRTAAE